MREKRKRLRSRERATRSTEKNRKNEIEAPPSNCFPSLFAARTTPAFLFSGPIAKGTLASPTCERKQQGSKDTERGREIKKLTSPTMARPPPPKRRAVPLLWSAVRSILLSRIRLRRESRSERAQCCTAFLSFSKRGRAAKRERKGSKKSEDFLEGEGVFFCQSPLHSLSN